MRTPRLVIDSKKWTDQIVVIFNDQLDIDCISDSFVDELMNKMDIDRDEAIDILVDDLHADTDRDAHKTFLGGRQ